MMRIFMTNVILAIAGAGCALSQSSTPTVVKECVLPTDQSKTLAGRWPATAIPVAFHQGDFAAGEISDMNAAIVTWNKFFQASLNITMINAGTDSNNPNTSGAAKPTTLCTQGIIQGSQYSGQVVVYKQTRWPYTTQPDAMAITSFCQRANRPYSTMYMAIMEINYQNFFVAGRRLPDLRTIFLHELGHLVGLHHSCEKGAKEGTPNCTSSSLDPNYFNAVMFPVFRFDESGMGEQKRVLAENDQGRANCLYKDFSQNSTSR